MIILVINDSIHSTVARYESSASEIKYVSPLSISSAVGNHNKVFLIYPFDFSLHSYLISHSAFRTFFVSPACHFPAIVFHSHSLWSIRKKIRPLFIVFVGVDTVLSFFLSFSLKQINYKFRIYLLKQNKTIPSQRALLTQTEDIRIQ